MKTKLQTLIIRFADSDHKTCGINSLYVMVSTRPRSWCQHAPMASTSRNACINSPHVMVSTHLESWYQLAPGHGINLPQVKLTRWMEVIQWIFMHEILQNIADNVQKCAMNDGLCENVRWTENCVENGNLCDIALAALKYCLCNWYRSIRAVSSTSHHRIAQSTGGYFSMIKSMPRERETSLLFTLGNNVNCPSSDGNALSTAIETHWYQMCIDPHDKGSRWHWRHRDFSTSVHGIQNKYKDFVLL